MAGCCHQFMSYVPWHDPALGYGERMSQGQQDGAEEAAADAVKWLTRLGRPVTEESVRELAPYMSGPRPTKGSLHARAFAHLVRRGRTPTAEAIAGLVANWQQRDAFFAYLDDPLVLRRVADFVDSVVQETGAGPLVGGGRSYGLAAEAHHRGDETAGGSRLGDLHDRNPITASRPPQAQPQP